ncbi:hypothetical protein AGDE_14305 [Angomonas deanei]|uniref:Uncharacterized protein n=1 Tax=Angomonas deanei TaxID=59799 RepID=A0A7G2CJU1_9TRYP|nr:hypothetical protein AGDE_14305 [Angomonas deanei]CAD2219659.1 hypothetical protein, conserved [Angomonas deanei]|eukprot:EPY21066.1 hypothetical protein AGDE_14305 [Angomonas deanei]
MLNQVDSSSAELDEFHSSLLTLHVLLSFQRGLISEVLRSCRVLLRFSNQPAPPLLVNWFREKGGDLEPSRRCHVLATHLHTMHKDESRMNSPAALTVSGGSTVLSFACGENCVYIHDAAGVKKFVQVNDTFALDKTTEFPINVCAKASKSSMVVCGGTLFLLTDLMESENVGVVSYTDSLETFKAFSLSEMHPAWPRHVDQLATLAAGDNATFGLVCHSGGTSPKWKSPMEVQIFHRSTFPKLHYRKSLSCLTSLARPQYGLRIGRGSTVELGSPDTALGNANGHCTIEIWVQILQTKEQTCFYAHGDDSTTGEVFIDGTLLDNSFYVRGGFRHETRGTSMVSAPFPLLEATGPVHIVLSFDGKWHLYFNGAEVGTSTAPHVSLIAPKQTWKVGGTSSFLICGLRVWRVSRSSRAIVRDAARVLNEEKENLLVQMFFSEESGNTVYNYVPGAKESGGICCGEFEQVYLSNHPFRSNTDDALRACLRSGTAAQFENLASLHSCCIMENTLVLGKASSQDRAFRHTFAFFSLYTGEEIPSQVNFVGGKEMVRVTRDGNGTLHMFSGKRFGDTLGISCVRAPGQAASVCGDINLPEESSVPLVKDSCGSLALDFLSLLTRHSADAVSNQAKRLFTPLSDDVSKECVDEIRVILNEQVRTIKTHNARRTVTLSKEYSYLVISSVIHILLRLILRVKEFQLCSTAVGLNVKGEDGSVMGEPLLKELYSPQQRRGSRAGEESSESVIHILTDILNEGGFSFDEGLTLLAEAALREGIELFIPDVRVRASLLRDTMRSTNISSRPKSLSVLMDSITESFTHISSSTMLLCGGSENSPEYRRDLLSMLQLLLQESVDILKKRSGEGASDDMYGLKRLATLTQSIEVLQLLLISGEEESDEEPNSRSELSTCGKHDASSEYLKLLFRVTAQGLEVNLKPDASKAFLFSAVYQFLVSIPVITTIDTSLGIADELDGLIKVLGKWIEDHPADEFREMRSRICTAMDAAKFSVCWVSAFMSTYSAVIVPSGQERWTAQRTVDHPVFLSGFVLDEPIQNYSPRRKFLTNFVDKKRDALVQPGPASTGAVPTVLDEVILRLAMASIYLSNISRLHAFPESKLQLLVVSTVKLFSPFRNKMFSQYGMNLEAYTSLNEKSRLVDHLISSYDVPVFYTVPGECGERGKHVDPLTPQDRWKWAFLRVRRALNLRRTHLVTSGSFDISSLVSFFSCVMSEEGLLREEVVEEVRKRRTLADIRAYGYQKRLTICQSNNASAGVVMSLSKKLGGQEPQHYAAGLCGSDVAVQFAIRQSVYSAVHLLLEKSGTEDTATGDPVLPLVDSLWAPADFPVLEKDGFHRQLFRRYCSLFSPDSSKMKEEDSTAIFIGKTQTASPPPT